jgi:hypothetical protein
LQIQRNLQLKIEAQGKKLQKMFEEQQMKANRTVMEPLQKEEDDDAFDDMHVQCLGAVRLQLARSAL